MKFPIKAVVDATLELDQIVFDTVDDEWRSCFYDLQTEEDIVNHIGYNMLHNGLCLSEMDGFADLPNCAAILHNVEWEME